jgi:hypothetical protein
VLDPPNVWTKSLSTDNVSRVILRPTSQTVKRCVRGISLFESMLDDQRLLIDPSPREDTFALLAACVLSDGRRKFNVEP